MERVDIYLKDIFPFFMILGRVLGMMITSPGFGEVYIPVTVRLILAAGLTLALTFIASSHIPAMPISFWESSKKRHPTGWDFDIFFSGLSKLISRGISA